MSDIVTTLTLDALRETLQASGYRVEQLTDPVANVPYLRSATAGLAFDVRPGNRFVGEDQGFADVAFVAALQVQGELPLDIVNRWNVTRRFGRLQLSQPFLVFCLDVSVAGGVAPNYLRGQVEIWDRLVQELIAYLRDELQKLGAAQSQTVQNPTATTDAPVRDASAEANAATIQ